MPISLKVSVYNSAGERVRSLFDGSASLEPVSLTLSSGIFVEGGDDLLLGLGALLSNGSTSLRWQGENNSGQLVASGSYTVKVEISDQWGRVTSLNQTVQVLASQVRNSVEIFNSAGERVFSGDLSPTAGGYSGLLMDQDSLVTGANGQPQDWMRCRLVGVKGTQTVWAWDGRNSRGYALQPGVYMIRVVDAANASRQVVTKSFLVLAGPDASPAPDPFVAPNPAPASGMPGLGRCVKVYYRPGTLAAGASTTLYDLAGGMVGRSVDPDASGEFRLDYSRLGGGLYLAVVEGRSPSGKAYRKTLKLGVIR